MMVSCQRSREENTAPGKQYRPQARRQQRANSSSDDESSLMRRLQKIKFYWKHVPRQTRRDDGSSSSDCVPRSSDSSVGNALSSNGSQEDMVQMTLFPSRSSSQVSHPDIPPDCHAPIGQMKRRQLVAGQIKTRPAKRLRLKTLERKPLDAALSDDRTPEHKIFSYGNPWTRVLSLDSPEKKVMFETSKKQNLPSLHPQNEAFNVPKKRVHPKDVEQETLPSPVAKRQLFLNKTQNKNVSLEASVKRKFSVGTPKESLFMVDIAKKQKRKESIFQTPSRKTSAPEIPMKLLPSKGSENDPMPHYSFHKLVSLPSTPKGQTIPGTPMKRLLQNGTSKKQKHQVVAEQWNNLQSQTPKKQECNIHSMQQALPPRTPKERALRSVTYTPRVSSTLKTQQALPLRTPQKVVLRNITNSPQASCSGVFFPGTSKRQTQAFLPETCKKRTTPHTIPNRKIPLPSTKIKVATFSESITKQVSKLSSSSDEDARKHFSSRGNSLKRQILPYVTGQMQLPQQNTKNNSAFLPASDQERFPESERRLVSSKTAKNQVSSPKSSETNLSTCESVQQESSYERRNRYLRVKQQSPTFSERSVRSPGLLSVKIPGKKGQLYVKPVKIKLPVQTPSRKSPCYNNGDIKHSNNSGEITPPFESQATRKMPKRNEDPTRSQVISKQAVVSGMQNNQLGVQVRTFEQVTSATSSDPEQVSNWRYVYHCSSLTSSVDSCYDYSTDNQIFGISKASQGTEKSNTQTTANCGIPIVQIHCDAMDFLPAYAVPLKWTVRQRSLKSNEHDIPKNSNSFRDTISDAQTVLDRKCHLNGEPLYGIEPTGKQADTCKKLEKQQNTKKNKPLKSNVHEEKIVDVYETNMCIKKGNCKYSTNEPHITEKIEEDPGYITSGKKSVGERSTVVSESEKLEAEQEKFPPKSPANRLKKTKDGEKEKPLKSKGKIEKKKRRIRKTNKDGILTPTKVGENTESKGIGEEKNIEKMEEISFESRKKTKSSEGGEKVTNLQGQGFELREKAEKTLDIMEHGEGKCKEKKKGKKSDSKKVEKTINHKDLEEYKGNEKDKISESKEEKTAYDKVSGKDKSEIKRKLNTSEPRKEKENLECKVLGKVKKRKKGTSDQEKTTEGNLQREVAVDTQERKSDKKLINLSSNSLGDNFVGDSKSKTEEKKAEDILEKVTQKAEEKKLSKETSVDKRSEKSVGTQKKKKSVKEKEKFAEESEPLVSIPNMDIQSTEKTTEGNLQREVAVGTQERTSEKKLINLSSNSLGDNFVGYSKSKTEEKKEEDVLEKVTQKADQKARETCVDKRSGKSVGTQKKKSVKVKGKFAEESEPSVSIPNIDIQATEKTTEGNLQREVAVGTKKRKSEKKLINLSSNSLVDNFVGDSKSKSEEKKEEDVSEKVTQKGKEEKLSQETNVDKRSGKSAGTKKKKSVKEKEKLVEESEPLVSIPNMDLQAKTIHVTNLDVVIEDVVKNFNPKHELKPTLLSDRGQYLDQCIGDVYQSAKGKEGNAQTKPNEDTIKDTEDRDVDINVKREGSPPQNHEKRRNRPRTVVDFLPNLEGMLERIANRQGIFIMSQDLVFPDLELQNIMKYRVPMNRESRSDIADEMIKRMRIKTKYYSFSSSDSEEILNSDSTESQAIIPRSDSPLSESVMGEENHPAGISDNPTVPHAEIVDKNTSQLIQEVTYQNPAKPKKSECMAQISHPEKEDSEGKAAPTPDATYPVCTLYKPHPENRENGAKPVSVISKNKKSSADRVRRKTKSASVISKDKKSLAEKVRRKTKPASLPSGTVAITKSSADRISPSKDNSDDDFMGLAKSSYNSFC